MGAFYIAAASTTGAGPISHIVCNTTIQCVAIDPNMACSNSLCVCPSSSQQPLASGDGLCNFTGTSSPWMGVPMLLSGFVLIILLVISFCVFTQWSYGLRWAKRYISGKESAPTLHVWSQASMGDLTPSVPIAPMHVSQNSDSAVTPTTPRQLDSDLFAGGSGSLRDSWMAALADRSSELTNQMTSMTELRGLFSAADESFVRPVLSGEEMYSKYPHLRLILTSSSSSSGRTPAERPPAVVVPYRTETTPPSASHLSTEARWRCATIYIAALKTH
ncbi:hypothetical protein MTO96_019758 [Rhipicephalus appendiculatus]